MSAVTEEAWVPTDTFGNRLILVRRELHLTVKEAAAKCGVHYATWSTWENGTKPGDMAQVVSTIASRLRVRRDWLMWGGPLVMPPTPGDEGTNRRYGGIRLVGRSSQPTHSMPAATLTSPFSVAA